MKVKIRRGFRPQEIAGLRFDGSGGLTVRADIDSLADTLLGVRALQAFDTSPARFPVQREFRFAVRRPLAELFDDLALRVAPRAQRLSPGAVVLEGDGYFASASGRRKIGYTSGKVDVWAIDVAHLAVAERALTPPR